MIAIGDGCSSRQFGSAVALGAVRLHQAKLCAVCWQQPSAACAFRPNDDAARRGPRLTSHRECPKTPPPRHLPYHPLRLQRPQQRRRGLRRDPELCRQRFRRQYPARAAAPPARRASASGGRHRRARPCPAQMRSRAGPVHATPDARSQRSGAGRRPAKSPSCPIPQGGRRRRSAASAGHRGRRSRPPGRRSTPARTRVAPPGRRRHRRAVAGVAPCPPRAWRRTVAGAAMLARARPTKPPADRGRGGAPRAPSASRRWPRRCRTDAGRRPGGGGADRPVPAHQRRLGRPPAGSRAAAPPGRGVRPAGRWCAAARAGAERGECRRGGQAGVAERQIERVHPGLRVGEKPGGLGQREAREQSVADRVGGCRNARVEPGQRVGGIGQRREQHRQVRGGAPIAVTGWGWVPTRGETIGVGLVRGVLPGRTQPRVRDVRVVALVRRTGCDAPALPARAAVCLPVLTRQDRPAAVNDRTARLRRRPRPPPARLRAADQRRGGEGGPARHPSGARHGQADQDAGHA